MPWVTTRHNVLLPLHTQSQPPIVPTSDHHSPHLTYSTASSNLNIFSTSNYLISTLPLGFNSLSLLHLPLFFSGSNFKHNRSIFQALCNETLRKGGKQKKKKNHINNTKKIKKLIIVPPSFFPYSFLMSITILFYGTQLNLLEKK